MNVPKLRFKEFDGKWMVRKLGDLCSTFKSGAGITSEQINDFDDYPVYGGNGLRGFTNTFTHDGFYLLIGRQGALCGNINRSDGKAYISEHAIAVSGNNLSDTNWLAYKLDYLKLNRFSESSAQPGLSVNKLIKLEFAVPSKSEQTKIANFLIAVDEKITHLTQKSELLAQYKKGVMQKIFSQELRFKDDDGHEFPAWDEATLGDVTELFSRRNKKLIDAKIYSVTNTNGFVLQTEHFEDREIAGADLSNYKIIYKDEFAYNPARVNVGSIALFTDEIGVISSLYVCFKCKPSLDKTFLLNFLELDSTKQNINSFGEGGVRIYLWYPLFAQIPISFPCIQEQTKIANFLTVIDDKITQTQAELAEVKQYKQGLLQQLFV